ncbi:MAG: phosphonate metabolism transcriptional regulator PhnF [Desulfocurvibacter africanus]
MDLRRGSGTSLWKQIQKALEQDIAGGVYAPGEKLPTESEFAVRFGVNRHTLRRALAALTDRGYVRVEQGRGTYVQEQVIDYSLKKRVSFSENLLGQKRMPGGSYLGCESVTADHVVAKALRLKPGTLVLRMDSTGEADGKVIGAFSHFFPEERFRGIEEHFRQTGSISESLRRCGIDDYARKWTRITARMPTPADADLLDQPRSKPVLVTESVNVDNQGRPIEYGLARWAGDRVHFFVEQDAHDANDS